MARVSENLTVAAASLSKSLFFLSGTIIAYWLLSKNFANFMTTTGSTIQSGA